MRVRRAFNGIEHPGLVLLIDTFSIKRSTILRDVSGAWSNKKGASPREPTPEFFGSGRRT